MEKSFWHDLIMSSRNFTLHDIIYFNVKKTNERGDCKCPCKKQTPCQSSTESNETKDDKCFKGTNENFCNQKEDPCPKTKKNRSKCTLNQCKDPNINLNEPCRTETNKNDQNCDEIVSKKEKEFTNLCKLLENEKNQKMAEEKKKAELEKKFCHLQEEKLKDEAKFKACTDQCLKLQEELEKQICERQKVGDQYKEQFEKNFALLQKQKLEEELALQECKKQCQNLEKELKLTKTKNDENKTCKPEKKENPCKKSLDKASQTIVDINPCPKDNKCSVKQEKQKCNIKVEENNKCYSSQNSEKNCTCDGSVNSTCKNYCTRTKKCFEDPAFIVPGKKLIFPELKKSSSSPKIGRAHV